MTPKKTVTKPTKKVTAVKKSTPKEPPAPKVEPVKQHAKVLVFMFSVGNDDRKRNLAQFEADIKKGLENLKANHITRTGGYYIIDGKVCLEQDYDEKTENYKPGKSAPPWAGGEMGNTAVERATGGEQKGTQPVKMRTPAEALDDLHKNTEWGRKKAAELEARAAASARSQEDDDVEEFEWDADDVTDSAKLEKVADDNTAAAIKRLKSGKSIKIKKSTGDPAPKKVVKKTAARPTGMRLASDSPADLDTVEQALAKMRAKKGTSSKKVVKRRK